MGEKDFSDRALVGDDALSFVSREVFRAVRAGVTDPVARAALGFVLKQESEPAPYQDACDQHFVIGTLKVRVVLEAREQALLASAFAAQSQETVFLDFAGKPFHLSPRAANWLAYYFPTARDRGDLPESVADWIGRVRYQREDTSKLSAPRPPLRAEKPDARLEILWFSDGQGREMLLLTEKRSLFAPDRLAQVGLTRRESEVLRWMAEGKTDSEIGLIIGASEHTAHKHAQNILRKLGVSSRATALLRVCELLGAV